MFSDGLIISFIRPSEILFPPQSMMAILTILLILLIACCADIAVSLYTRRYSSHTTYSLPSRRFALVLGTAKFIGNGSINRYYQYRIEAAIELWQSGKVEAIVVSGSGLHDTPSETICMQADLVSAGIPEQSIWQDTAGLRTLDSIIRFAHTFPHSSVCIVSQPFHNQRALIQAHAYGLDAIAYHAQAIGAKNGWKVHLRERFARLRLWYDLLTRQSPHYPTSQIPIHQYPTEAQKCRPYTET